jgi:hypothetical protein
MRFWICCALLPVLVGCGTMLGKKPPVADPGQTGAKAPKTASIPKYRVPGPKHQGPEMNMKYWMVQCGNADLAMTCRKSDRTDRRCAVKRKGRYRWTYGSYCKAAALPCYKRACN